MTYAYLYKFKLAIIARENSRVSLSVSVDIVSTHTHTYDTHTHTCIFRTYMTDLVLTRHTYIPVLSSFAETMLVPRRAKDARQDVPSVARHEKKTGDARKKHADSTLIRVRSRGAFRITMRACVRACDTKTMRSRRYLDASRRTTTRPTVRDPEGKLLDTHTHTHASAYRVLRTHVSRHACALPRRARPRKHEWWRPFSRKFAGKRCGESGARAGKQRAHESSTAADLQRSRGPSAFSVDARVRSSRDRDAIVQIAQSLDTRVIALFAKIHSPGKYRYRNAITRMNDTNDDSFVKL